MLRKSNVMQPIRHLHTMQRRAIRKQYDNNVERYKLLTTEEAPSRFKACLYRGDKVMQICDMMNTTDIRIDGARRFQSWIDVGLNVRNFDKLVDNKPFDCSVILESSLDELLERFATQKSNPIARQNVGLIEGVSSYIDRIIGEIDRMLLSGGELSQPMLAQSRDYFSRMKYAHAESLEEALQRILFWTDLFWQSGHRLVGLGRLDKALAQFVLPDDAMQCIVDFYDALHRYFPYKSNSVAVGDTGQIVVLGGIEPDGSYFVNEYTRFFIEALIDHPLPDPKVLLRVSSRMPIDLMELALECISTGIGCPLLSNDDVVVPALEQFGYSHEDACDYVVSACWEPQAYRNSLELNNIADVNLAEALVDCYSDDRFEDCRTFMELVNLYLDAVDKQTAKTKAKLERLRWERDPLTTLFMDSCLERGKDVSEGGAVYNNYGVLTEGMGNAVNSLITIKNLCFDESCVSLRELKSAAMGNFEGQESLLKLLKEQSDFFGRDDPETIELVDKVRERICSKLSSFRNPFGGKVKWGLSSPNYLEHGKATRATLDGRLDGEPLMTHISARGPVAPTELVMFAGSFDYSGQQSNGNVVDFFVSPSFIEANFTKFVSFLMMSIDAGFFQMQMNVVDASTLIDAREHPEQYPNLIVRVWGFSAIFVDLPFEYQDVLIQRALASEGRNDEVWKIAV